MSNPPRAERSDPTTYRQQDLFAAIMGLGAILRALGAQAHGWETHDTHRHTGRPLKYAYAVRGNVKLWFGARYVYVTVGDHRFLEKRRLYRLRVDQGADEFVQALRTELEDLGQV